MKAKITIAISANRITTDMLKEAIEDVHKFNINDDSDLLEENSRIMHNSTLSGDKDMSWVIDVEEEPRNFRNPVCAFIPATHNVPSTNRDVFVIAENGMIGTGHYHRHNGKGEWRVSFQNGEFYHPVWWAEKPDTTEKATGYKFDAAMLIHY